MDQHRVKAFACLLLPPNLVCRQAAANIAAPFNAMIASRYFGERFNVRPPLRRGAYAWLEWDLGGVVLMLSGAVLVVAFAPAPPGGSTTYSLREEQDMLKTHLALAFLLVCVPEFQCKQCSF